MNSPKEAFNLAKYHKTRIDDMETLQPTTPPELSKKRQTYVDDQSINQERSPLGQKNQVQKACSPQP